MSNLVRICLLEPWGERPVGQLVDVDPTRAAQMVARETAEVYAEPVEAEPQTELKPRSRGGHRSRPVEE